MKTYILVGHAVDDIKSPVDHSGKFDSHSQMKKSVITEIQSLGSSLDTVESYTLPAEDEQVS